LEGKVDTNFRDLDAKIEDKFEHMENRVLELEGAKVAGAGSGAPSGAQAWAQQPAGSSSAPWIGPPPQAPFVQDSWNRIPNPAIVTVSTDKRTKVSLVEVTKSIVGFAAEKSIPAETFEVSGPELGTRFSITFCGFGVIASGLVTRFLKSIKNSDDTYYAFTAKDPSGNFCTLHPNADKNGHTQKLEGTSRRLSNHLKQAYPECAAKLFCRRTDGVITYDFKELVEIEVGRRKSSLSWNKQLAKSCKIDKDAETARFEELENIQWEP
jgi:hypothetical protein